MSLQASDGQARNGIAQPTVLYDAVARITTYTYPCEPRQAPPAVRVEHDRKRRRLRIIGRDGQTAEFADRPTRFLVLARDPSRNELRPVVMRGEPVVYYLCPEAGTAGDRGVRPIFNLGTAGSGDRGVRPAGSDRFSI
jgi:hypothetical protein